MIDLQENTAVSLSTELREIRATLQAAAAGDGSVMMTPDDAETLIWWLYGAACQVEAMEANWPAQDDANPPVIDFRGFSTPGQSILGQPGPKFRVIPGGRDVALGPDNRVAITRELTGETPDQTPGDNPDRGGAA